MGYKTVIFDLDGTLLDTLDDLTASVNHAMKKMGWNERSKDEIRSFVGNGIRRLMELSVPSGISEELFEQAFICFKEYYDLHNQEMTRPYDGVLEMMQRLKEKNIRMAIVSNKVDSAVQMLRERFFDKTVEIAIGDTPGQRRKPQPDSCLKALALLNSTKEETVYVGDSDVDLETAKNTGVDCISVLWGFRDAKFLKEHGASLFAKTPEEVERYVLG